ncbi:hypothetical protein VSDG_03949 [Cytospora chrysosperma]|uniref:AB hydrolase-1 domain-containing protein n=1 Tax=Cytospora chrysosperma TaxID=252740 RepID=A0A423W7H0_CYTCH|nr:hypothetical protein VSDG_03949 [Valsa sordida]
MYNVAFMNSLGPPTWRADTETSLAVLTNKPPPAELFYHDLLATEAERWTLELKKNSLKTLFEGGELAYAGWRDVPCEFLVTVEDKALPMEAQMMTIGMARDAGGGVEVREVDSGYNSMLTRSQDTANFLVEAAKALSVAV